MPLLPQCPARLPPASGICCIFPGEQVLTSPVAFSKTTVRGGEGSEGRTLPIGLSPSCLQQQRLGWGRSQGLGAPPTQLSHVGTKSSVAQAVHFHLQDVNCWQTGNRSQSRQSNRGPPVWDTGLVSTRPCGLVPRGAWEPVPLTYLSCPNPRLEIKGDHWGGGDCGPIPPSPAAQN